MAHAPGDRIVAVADADEHHVRSYGTGTYAGDHPYNTNRRTPRVRTATRSAHANPPADPNSHADGNVEGEERRPRIDLDGGGTVWGHACWAMTYERFACFAAGRTITYIAAPEHGTN